MRSRHRFGAFEVLLHAETRLGRSTSASNRSDQRELGRREIVVRGAISNRRPVGTPRDASRVIPFASANSSRLARPERSPDSHPRIVRCRSVRDVENPSAPASMPSLRARAIIASSTSRGSSSGSPPRSPITYARSAAWGMCVATSMVRAWPIECVEVFRERSPNPSGGPHGAPCPECPRRPPSSLSAVVEVRSDWCEPDSAVAHGDGCYAVVG